MQVDVSDKALTQHEKIEATQDILLLEVTFFV